MTVVGLTIIHIFGFESPACRPSRAPPHLGTGGRLGERVCCGLELDPKHVDVSIQRWQTLSGQAAILEGDGRSFEQVAQQRLKQAA